MRVRLDWKGDDVRKRMDHAQQVGVNATAKAVAERAKTDRGWASRTGAAVGSIRAEPARRSGHQVIATVGSDLRYFIYLEIGSRGKAGDHTLRRALDGEGRNLASRVAGAFK